jgi:hypothetical protein
MLLLQSEYFLEYPKTIHLKHTYYNMNKLLKYYYSYQNKKTNSNRKFVYITQPIKNILYTIYQYTICPITFCSLCKIREMNIYNKPKYYYYDNSLKRIVSFTQ